LNLSQLAKAAQSFRYVEKSQRLSTAAKFETLQKIESKTAQETEVILCRELQIEPIIHLVHKEIAKRTLIQKKSPLPKPNTNPRQLRPIDRQRLVQNSCSYRDPETGRICGTKYFRQADHIHSVFLGGSREPENLQTLWVQHNSWKFHGRGSVTEVQSLEHAP
jgi:hypothetical protein